MYVIGQLGNPGSKFPSNYRRNFDEVFQPWSYWDRFVLRFVRRLLLNGTIAVEPTMDPADVARGRIYRVSSSQRQCPIHDHHGDQDALPRPRVIVSVR